jgi:hypothetical protein
VFEKHFGLVKGGNVLTFTFENKDVLERRIDELEIKGITLPQPKENSLHFNYDNKPYEQNESNLNFEAFRLIRLLKKYFPDNPFDFYYKTEYVFESRKFDEGIGVFESKEDLFWTRLYSEIHGDEFQISQTHRTISFDFETESELIEA